MVDLGERTPFFEEALHAISERREILGGARSHDVAFGPQHQRRWQVLLDRDRSAAIVEGAIDDREPTAADLTIDAVVQELVAGRQGLVGGAHGLG